MKLWRKSLFVLIAVTMSLALLLSGCGGNSTKGNEGSQSGNNESNNNGAVDVTSKKDIKGEITVGAWEYIEQSLQSALPEFNKEYPNIKVNFKVSPPTDHYQKLLLDLSSGQGAPDIVAIEIQNLAQYMELGKLIDVSNLMALYEGQFNEYKVQNATLNGKIYAMPIDSGPVGVYYRRDVFNKADLPSDPQSVAAQLATWDKYVETAKLIKERTGIPMLPLAGSTNDARFFQILMQQNETWYFDVDGKTAVDNDNTKQVLNLFKQLWDGEYTADVLDWTDGWYAVLNEGKVATLPMAVWMGGFLKSWVAPDTAGEWGVVPLPVWDGKSNRTSNDGGSYLAITDQTKNEEAARAFIEFMLAKNESQMSMFKELDSFPSLMTTYNDPYFAEEDPYFAGQAYRQVFAELADEIIPVNYTGSYSEANSLAQIEIQKLATNKQTVDQTLKAMQETIKSKTGR